MPNIFEIIFKSRREGDGAKETRQELEAARKQADGLSDELKDVGKASKQGLGDAKKETRGLKDTLADTEEAAKGGLGSIKELASSLPAPLKLVSLAAGGVLVAINAIKSVLSSFSVQEDALVDLQAAMDATGQSSDSLKSKMISNAEELQDATNIGDEEWLATYAELLRHGMDSTNVDQVTGALQNLTALTKGDLNRATSIMIRMLNGNTEGLRELGIIVDSTGDKSKDLENAFRELADRGQGALEARTKTLSGTVQAMKNSWGDFKESIGALVARTGVLQSVIGGVTKVLRFFTRNLPPASDGMADLSDKVSIHADRLNELEEAQNRVNKSMEDAGGKAADLALPDLEESTKRIADNLTRARQEKDAMEDAGLASELANIDLAEAQGKISSEDARHQRSMARLKSQESKIDGRLDDIGAEIEKLNAEREDANNAFNEARAKADVTSQNLEEASASATTKKEHDRQLKRLQKDLAKSKQAESMFAGAGNNQQARAQREYQKRIQEEIDNLPNNRRDRADALNAEAKAELEAAEKRAIEANQTIPGRVAELETSATPLWARKKVLETQRQTATQVLTNDKQAIAQRDVEKQAREAEKLAREQQREEAKALREEMERSKELLARKEQELEDYKAQALGDVSEQHAANQQAQATAAGKAAAGVRSSGNKGTQRENASIKARAQQEQREADEAASLAESVAAGNKSAVQEMSMLMNKLQGADITPQLTSAIASFGQFVGKRESQIAQLEQQIKDLETQIKNQRS